MKFSVVVFVASFCLAAVTAKAIEDEYMELASFIDPMEDINMELESLLKQAAAIEEQNIDSIGSFKILVHCILEEIVKLDNATETFKCDVKKCEEKSDERVEKLLDLLDDLREIIHDMSNTYQITCKGGKRIHAACRRKIVTKAIMLGTKLVEIGKAIKDILDIPRDHTKCTLSASLALLHRIAQAPANINACRKNSC